MNDDGTMARVPQLIEFCRRHNLKLLTIAELIRYRMRHERYVKRIAETTLATRHGEFRMLAYSSETDDELHVVPHSRRTLRQISRRSFASIRIASPATSSARSLAIAAKSSTARSKPLPREDRGVFVYLHHTGRGFRIAVAAGRKRGSAPHTFPFARGN